MSENNLPEKKFRAGAISATVWKNQAQNKDKENITYRTVSFERNYKDKNDTWQTTSSLRVNDLPKAMLVLGKAYEYIALNNDKIDEETKAYCPAKRHPGTGDKNFKDSRILQITCRTASGIPGKKF